MNRLAKVNSLYKKKVASGSYTPDAVYSLSDLVTSGVDIPGLDKDVILKGLEQEGYDILQDMMYHSDFKRSTWIDKFCTLLKEAGFYEQGDRCLELAEQAADRVLNYLESMSFLVQYETEEP